MGNTYPMVAMLGLMISFGLTASPTFARNVVGAESSAEAEEKADEAKASKEESEKSAAEKEAAEKKRQEAAEKRRKQEEAERKAEQEAKEAALKKAAEVEKRKQEAELKKKRKQRERQENLLKSVKTNRRYARLVEGYRALVSVTPGGAKKNNVIEVTFQIFEPKKMIWQKQKSFPNSKTR